MEGGPDEEQQKQIQKQMELQMESMQKTIEELEAKAKDKEADTLKTVADVAMLIADKPTLAPIMDALMASIGKETSEQEQESESPEMTHQQLGMM